MPTYYLVHHPDSITYKFYVFMFTIDYRLLGFTDSYDVSKLVDAELRTAAKAVITPSIYRFDLRISHPSHLRQAAGIVLHQIPDLSHESIASLYPEYFI